MKDDTRTPDDAWFGHRRIALTPGPARLTLSDGVSVEWKSADVPAGTPGGVEARATLTDGLDTVEIDIPKGTGWCRLAVDLPIATTDQLLGLRILMRVTPRHATSPGAGALAVSAGEQREAGFAPIEVSTSRILYAPDIWHEVTGALACPAGKADLRAVLNLPEDHQVTLAVADTGQLPVTWSPDASTSPIVIAPFRARALTPEAARRRAAAPPVFAADARLEGFRVTGWAFAGGTTGVVLSSPDASGPCPAETGLTAMLTAGLTAACGFEADVAPLCATSAPMTCHLGTDAGHSPAFATLSRHAGVGDIAEAAPLLFSAPVEPADPYQRLVNQALKRATPEPGGLEAALEAIADPTRRGRTTILHLTSLAGFLNASPDASAARRQADDLGRQLAFFVHQGGRLVWSLRSPPKGRWPEAEIQLGRIVAGLGGPIHLHSPRLTKPLSDAWGIRPVPEQVQITPLGGTVGLYPDYMPTKTARNRLGLPENAPLFVLFGRLGSGKGIAAAVAAFDRLRETVPEAHLLIVGEPRTTEAPGRLRHWLAGRAHVQMIESRPADITLQWYLCAADWALMPYQDARTPEALATMMSFGLPAIAPARGMIPEIVNSATGLLYEPDAPEGLENSLRRAVAIPPDERRAMGAAARAAMARRDWAAAARALEMPPPAPAARPVTLRFEDGTRTALMMGKPLPEDRPARTAIVILNYDNCDDTTRLIASLRAGTDTDFDIFVVDNASPSVTPEELRQRFAGCHIIVLPENLGYAAGNNAALQLIREIGHRYVLILNPDLVAPPDTLTGLIAGAEAHSGAAVFAPALLRGGGSGRTASAGCYLGTTDGIVTGHMFAGDPEADLPGEAFEADFVTGAAMFLSQETLRRIGPIPEQYFLYFEESAWLTAAARDGVPSIVLPHIRLEHHKRSEDGHVPARHYFYYYIRNIQLFAAELAAQGRDPGQAATLDRLQRSFIGAWMWRIWRGSPDLLPAFRALADQALVDGAAGRTGPVDLLATMLTGAGPDLPTVDSAIAGGLRLKLEARDMATPRLTGDLVLPPGIPAAGPWRIDVVHGGQVIASAEAGPPKFASAASAPVDIALPANRLRPGTAQSFELYLNGRKTGSVSAYVADILPACSGAITGFGNDGLTGWLRPETPAGGVLEVEILCQGAVVARGHADLPTKDRAAGFALHVPRALTDGVERVFSLRLSGQDTPVAEARLAHLAGDADLLGRDAAGIAEALAHHHEIRIGPNRPGAYPLTRIRFPDPPPADSRHVTIVMPVMTEAEIDAAAASWATVQTQSHAAWMLCLVPASPALEALLRARMATRDDERVSCLATPLPETRAAARNAGLAATDSPVIAHLDPGVTWHPQFLARMLTQIDDTTPAALAAEWLTQVVPVGNGEGVEIVAIRGGQQSLARLENRPVAALSTLVSTRAAFDTVGGFDAALGDFEGWDLMLRLAYHGMAPRALALPLVTGPTDPPAPARLADPRSELAHKRIGARIDRLASGIGLPADSTIVRRSTDIALLAPPGPGQTRGLAERMTETLAPFTRDDVRGLVVAPGQLSPSLRDALAQSGLPCSVIGVETETVPAENASHAMLTEALTWRRPTADLLLIRPETLVQGGALDAIAEAIATVPDAGIVVTRHGVPGDSDVARTHAPGSWPERDTCIAISALSENLDAGAFDPARGLATLTTPDPFCLSFTPEMASALLEALNTAGPAPLETLLGELSARLCREMGRRIIYSGRARAFELPL